MRPLGIYIHIPYCIHKCGYCDFNSHDINLQEMDSYTDALLAELMYYSKNLSQNTKISSIFFGGGTPTTLPFHTLSHILKSCFNEFDVVPNAEITTEANPATIDGKELKILKEAGFNRISIGVQSFSPEELIYLERTHNVDEIYSTVEKAREADFDNLSLDLMFSLPNQTLSTWEKNLKLAIALNPEHISAYNLTIEPGTRFYKYQDCGDLVMPSEDSQLSQFQTTIRILLNAGYNHYEISNYSKSGRECRHNILYWENGEYLGLGAGATSYLNGVRHKNYNLPAHYIKEVQNHGTAAQSEEKLNKKQSMGETLMLGLRMRSGVNLNQFEQKFKVSIQSVYSDVIEKLLKNNLISFEENYLTLTDKGLLLADTVILEFIS